MNLHLQVHKYLLLVLACLNCMLGFAQLKTAKTPNWVTSQNYEKNPKIDADEISYGLLTLLSDEQINIPKQEHYVRLVRKITDNVGVQDGSSISINFDPTYQKLVLHEINITRNDDVMDRLNIDDFQTIRQESNADSYIYDGTLNALANLSDIRNGDIIDLSYTIKGFNPIHNNHFSSGFSLNDYQPVGKINIVLIADKELNYKTLNTDLKPKIKRSNGLIIYQWENMNTEKPDFEDNTVSWHLSYQSLFVTDYNNWNEVVNWALEIYGNTPKFSEELEKKVQQIQNESNSEGKRIESTLRFIQNEIRYLGLESGIGAYKPFSPSKVYEQRFGDCKDKSWLMVSMLRKMGIKAYPVLVNTTYGGSLDKFMPTPKAFDHVVVKVIDSTATGLFYDPTNTNQYGSFKSIAFPDYGKVLVIKEGINALEAIENNREDLVEVFDIYNLETVGGNATLNVTTVYHEAEADIMRNMFKTNSLKSLNKEFESYYTKYYDNVEVLKDIVYEDDSIYNKFTVEESYRIDDIWKPMLGNEKNISVDFSPYSIHDIFVSPNEKHRKTPLALYYPTKKKHNITVKLPQRWSMAKDFTKIESESFEYSLKAKMNRSQNILYLNYTYSNKKGYVMPEDYPEYYEKAKEAEQILSYYIYIPKSAANTSINTTKALTKDYGSTISTILYIVFGAIIIVGIGLVTFVIASNRSRQNE